ncbi:MAG: hypothetical protein RQ824_01885 [bacterium]|nr:hypothetical protein [bacterium]
MSFKEMKELEEAPQQIEALEEAKEELYKIMADPDNYQTGGEKIAKAKLEADSLEEKLSSLYKRWEELEEVKAAFDEAES